MFKFNEMATIPKKLALQKKKFAASSDFYSTGPENITIISSLTKKCSMCYKKGNNFLKKQQTNS